jgi:hypothetical protein
LKQKSGLWKYKSSMLLNLKATNKETCNNRTNKFNKSSQSPRVSSLVCHKIHRHNLSTAPLLWHLKISKIWSARPMSYFLNKWTCSIAPSYHPLEHHRLKERKKKRKIQYLSNKSFCPKDSKSLFCVGDQNKFLLLRRNDKVMSLWKFCNVFQARLMIVTAKRLPDFFPSKEINTEYVRRNEVWWTFVFKVFCTHNLCQDLMTNMRHYSRLRFQKIYFQASKSQFQP